MIRPKDEIKMVSISLTIYQLQCKTYLSNEEGDTHMSENRRNKYQQKFFGPSNVQSNQAVVDGAKQNDEAGAAQSFAAAINDAASAKQARATVTNNIAQNNKQFASSIGR